jgi:hypothetical protein
MHRQFRLAVQLIPVISPRVREVRSREPRRSTTVSGVREMHKQTTAITYLKQRVLWITLFVPRFQLGWNFGIANWNLGI